MVIAERMEERSPCPIGIPKLWRLGSTEVKAKGDRAQGRRLGFGLWSGLQCWLSYVGCRVGPAWWARIRREGKKECAKLEGSTLDFS